ncbi:peptide chain release factor-like protein [Rubinisphaera sp.]|uniref:peptide chain release factor family protein n=1 Tax=Rubinisphaera sp. TaxID=2024857 RepID=UPI000C1066BC|nr:peptide chain release factor-like protein [Rubinisphaera sp.]MBV08071.1 peptide chain release factor-like protein [Rubinisphaera sp.]HCS51855.1 peptide chain release factor-like protein [Planctomycetaceae bacterium]|tara:strand:+ start:276 stop:779 length:504 start_codon:yes stop_codon:yes gene_type:complete
MHPSALPEEELLLDCQIKRQRRSGPGGQHRNKVETAIRILHQPTGLSSQASERRSQAENQKQAIERLRIQLALNFRTAEKGDEIPPSELWQSRVQGEKIVVSPHHPVFATLLAEAMDQLLACNWDHKLAAERLGITSSQIIKFLKLEPEALKLLNQHRDEQGMKGLT